MVLIAMGWDVREDGMKVQKQTQEVESAKLHSISLILKDTKTLLKTS